MNISKFDYELPKGRIANSPAEPRDSSKLLILDRTTKEISHYNFSDITKFLKKNDVLVFNNTKVFPARLFGKKSTGGKIEILLLEKQKGTWKAIHRGSLKQGDKVIFESLQGTVLNKDGKIATIEFNKSGEAFQRTLTKLGHTPLPPYINSDKEENELREIYQTVYAKQLGSAAAPTAGFHFTKNLLDEIQGMGIKLEYITLHVGLGTFAPVKTEVLEDHDIHSERYSITKETAQRLNSYKLIGKRIVAVGTTTTRVLESSLDDKNNLIPQENSTDLFIYPPYEYKFVDSLITNFHLPKSTLLALVSAFVSQPNTNEKFKDLSSSMIGKAYNEAIKNDYRFYSFGDAMLIE